MFTGIIEHTGRVTEIISWGSNKTFWIRSELAASLKVDQSLCHDGVCLTVEEIKGDLHRVTAIEETLKKTNLGGLKNDSMVNLERSMQLNGRVDGHLVQGHVDTVATCTAINKKEGSHEFIFSFDNKFASLIIEKGSITVNGISLTCFNVTRDRFTVAIVPYTYAHTNMGAIKTGDTLNLEFDMIGKYVERILQNKI